MSKNKRRANVITNSQKEEVMGENEVIDEIIEETTEEAIAEDVLVEEEIAENIAEEVAIEENEEEPFYKVRLSWDNEESQIFASFSLDDCIEEATIHNGYKVFNSDGDLVNDPWKVQEDIDIDNNGPKQVILPATGRKVVLKNTPIFARPSSKTPSKTANGIYYFYDYTILNGRAKITENENIATDKTKNPSMIYGYIDIQKK